MVWLYIALLAGGTFGVVYFLLKFLGKGKEDYLDKFKLILKLMAITNKTWKEVMQLFDKDPTSDNAVEKAQKVFEAVYDALNDLNKWYDLYLKNSDLSDEDRYNLVFEKAYSFVKEQLKKIYKDQPVSDEIESLVKFLLENGIKLFFEKKK